MRNKNDERMIQIYNYINNFIKEYGVSPSYADISSAKGCSKSTLFLYMKRLEEEGYISRMGHNQIVTLENTNSIDRIPVIGVMLTCPHCGAFILADIDEGGRMRLSYEPPVSEKRLLESTTI